jgi:acetyl esterase/lipase
MLPLLDAGVLKGAPAEFPHMRNLARLKRLEQATTAQGVYKLFATSDDWLRLNPPLYLDCSGDAPPNFALIVSNDPATLPDEVAARLVNESAVQSARDAGQRVQVIRYGAWTPSNSPLN